MLDPQPGQRILDIGCGDGTLAREIAMSGATVVGIDASPSFVAAARANGVDALLVDARELAFENEFDGAFSNAALHWMGEPLPVLRGIRRALRPGARFVGELGGDGNVAIIRAAIHAALERRGIDAEAHDPWTFPTLANYRTALGDAGFAVDAIERFGRPTPLAAGLAAWLRTFAEPFFGGLTHRERSEVLAEVSAALTSASAASVRERTYVADYVRLRFIATARISASNAASATTEGC